MMQAVMVGQDGMWVQLPLGVAGLCNVKPLPLPVIGSFGKRTFWPRSAGEVVDRSTAALHLFPVDHLRLHTEGLEP